METAIDIPTVSLKFDRGNDSAATSITAIRRAATEVGFIKLVDHGIDDDLILSMIDTVYALDSLPSDYKSSLASPTGHPFRGYSVVRNGSNLPTALRFQINWFDGPETASRCGVPSQYLDYFHPNIWPTIIPHFKEIWTEYFKQTQALGNRLMRLFGEAMNLPESLVETYFGSSAFDPPASCLAANYYPPRVRTGSMEKEVIFREHIDSGTLTMLYQTGKYAGLQVLLGDGTWQNVPVHENSFVINFGALMERWTNGLWKATLHRVVSADDVAADRLSITTFHLPRVDLPIAPIPELIGEEDAHYATVTPYEWEDEFLSSYVVPK